MGKTTKLEEGLTPLDFIRSQLKSEVKKAGHTYESFARLFNRTEGWFSNLVNGRNRISIEILLEIADKLKISPASLLPKHGDEEAPKTLEEYIEKIVERTLEEKLEEVLKKKSK